MQQIKTSLKKGFEYTLRLAKESITKTELLQKQLEDVDVRKATYKVTLRSMWEDEGEENTETIHTGTIKGAIIASENVFKETNNNRSDVQARYSVAILIGDTFVDISSACWEEYRCKYQK